MKLARSLSHLLLEELVAEQIFGLPCRGVTHIVSDHCCLRVLDFDEEM